MTSRAAVAVGRLRLMEQSKAISLIEISCFLASRSYYDLHAVRLQPGKLAPGAWKFQDARGAYQYE